MEMRDRIRRRRPGTKRIPSRSGFTRFGCHDAEYSRERDKKNKNTSQPKTKKRKEKIHMHEICINM